MDTTKVTNTDEVGPSIISVAVGPSSTDPSMMIGPLPSRFTAFVDGIESMHILLTPLVIMIVTTQRDGSNVTYPCSKFVQVHGRGRPG